MAGNKDKVLSTIESMYDDQIPMVRFFGMKPDFKLPRSRLQVMLMPGNPATPEDSEKMLENADVYIDMMITAGILAIARPAKFTGKSHPGPQADATDQVPIIIAGEEFETFVAEAKDYVDTDSIIIRALGISRQDFDMVANEYEKLASNSANIDDILEAWVVMSMETKLGIMRGVLLQRSIMAQVLLTMRARTIPILQHEQETLSWIARLLGSDNMPQEPAKE